MSIINTKQINSPLNITGSLHGTSSWAEYVVNGSTGGGFPYVGNAVISGSLLISGSGLTVTGSLNSQSITGSLRGTASFATTSSHALNGGVTSINQGTGITVSSTTGNITVTNSAPDQVVSLTNGGSISIGGSYPSFTIQNTAPFPGFGYSQLLYVFSQAGTNNPNVTYSLNTTEFVFSFKRLNSIGPGAYQIKCENGSAFTAGQTAVYLSPGYTLTSFANSKEFLTWYEIEDASNINIYSYRIGSGPEDDVFSGATIDIKIY